MDTIALTLRSPRRNPKCRFTLLQNVLNNLRGLWGVTRIDSGYRHVGPAVSGIHDRAYIRRPSHDRPCNLDDLVIPFGNLILRALTTVIRVSSLRLPKNGRAEGGKCTNRESSAMSASSRAFALCQAAILLLSARTSRRPNPASQSASHGVRTHRSEPSLLLRPPSTPKPHSLTLCASAPGARRVD